VRQRLHTLLDLPKPYSPAEAGDPPQARRLLAWRARSAGPSSPHLVGGCGSCAMALRPSATERAPQYLAPCPRDLRPLALGGRVRSSWAAALPFAPCSHPARRRTRCIACNVVDAHRQRLVSLADLRRRWSRIARCLQASMVMIIQAATRPYEDAKRGNSAHRSTTSYRSPNAY
jgi:hypothetical protein